MFRAWRATICGAERMAEDRRGKRSKGIEAGSALNQSHRFIEAARELGADQPEEAFDDALRRIGKAPAPTRPRERKKPR